MPDISSEEEAQEAILAYLAATLPEDIHEQAIPNSQTVLRNSVGEIDPYIAIQFGDLQQGSTTSFAGPIGDDYILPVYIQAIAPSARIARRIGNRIRRAMLGQSFPWTGSVRKRPGGGMFPIVTSNGATEAYQSPASFGILIQYVDLT
jgi:hypothetical protein